MVSDSSHYVPILVITPATVSYIAVLRVLVFEPPMGSRLMYDAGNKHSRTLIGIYIYIYICHVRVHHQQQHAPKTYR